MQPRSPLATLVAACLTFWASGKAFDYGAVYDSITNPIETEVTLKDGRTYAGALSHTMEGTFVLVLPSGEQIHFKDFKVMAGAPVTATHVLSESQPFKHWRVTIGPSLVIAIFVVWFAFPTFSQRRRQALAQVA